MLYLATDAGAVYHASPHPIVPPAIQRIALADVLTADVIPMSTLYVPPLLAPRIDWAMARRLRLDRELVHAD